MSAENISQIDVDNFQREVLSSQQPVVVDFYADWCQPCRAQEPTIDALAEELDGRARFGKVNIDENPELVHDYGIRSIPSVFIFRDGQVVDRFVGLTSREDLKRALGGNAG